MDRHIFLLGTAHALQGAEKKSRNINDPAYTLVIRRLIEDHSLDFIFEEASEQGPTTAQNLADIHHIAYLDVDPNEDHREQHGLAKYTERDFDICPPGNIDMPKVGELTEKYVSAQIGREMHWVNQIRQRDFSCGLMICGFFHILSTASCLQSSGCEVTALSYYAV